jgi:hypothetical protein
LDALLDLIDQNPDAAKKLIADLKAQTRTTLADIRRLVYELRPPALDELGLVAALQAQWAAQDGLRVSIESPPGGLPPLSAAVEGVPGEMGQAHHSQPMQTLTLQRSPLFKAPALSNVESGQKVATIQVAG